MGKFSKIFHHIESKDLRNKYEQKKAAKIQEEKQQKEFKQYLVSTMETKKYNWREGMTTANSFSSVLPAEGDTAIDQVSPVDAASFASSNLMFGSGDFSDIWPAQNATEIRSSGSGSGSTGGFDVGGDYLAFQGTQGTTGARWALLKPMDATNVDTLTITAIRGTGSNGGEHPDVVGTEELYIRYKTPDMNISRYFTQDRDGNNVGSFPADAAIISINQGDGTLQDYTITIPEFARQKDVTFALYQKGHSGSQYDHYGVTDIKFQRKTPMTVFVPLDNPEASSFIRSAPPKSTPKKRKKDVDDKLQASDDYTASKFGDEFPGREVRVGGDDPFASAKIGDDVEPSPQGKDGVKKAFAASRLKSALDKPESKPTISPEEKLADILKTTTPKTNQPTSGKDLATFKTDADAKRTEVAVATEAKNSVKNSPEISEIIKGMTAEQQKAAIEKMYPEKAQEILDTADNNVIKSAIEQGISATIVDNIADITQPVIGAKTPANAFNEYNKFLGDIAKDPNTPGATYENPINMSNQITKGDMNDLTTTINSGNYQSIVNSIRATNDENAQKELKKQLDDMIKDTISGNFGLNNFMHNAVKVNLDHLLKTGETKLTKQYKFTFGASAEGLEKATFESNPGLFAIKKIADVLGFKYDTLGDPSSVLNIGTPTFNVGGTEVDPLGLLKMIPAIAATFGPAVVAKLGLTNVKLHGEDSYDAPGMYYEVNVPGKYSVDKNGNPIQNEKLSAAEQIKQTISDVLNQGTEVVSNLFSFGNEDMNAPQREDFPMGRSGAKQFSDAMKLYNAAKEMYDSGFGDEQYQSDKDFDFEKTEIEKSLEDISILSASEAEDRVMEIFEKEGEEIFRQLYDPLYENDPVYKELMNLYDEMDKNATPEGQELLKQQYEALEFALQGYAFKFVDNVLVQPGEMTPFGYENTSNQAGTYAGKKDAPAGVYFWGMTDREQFEIAGVDLAKYDEAEAFVEPYDISKTVEFIESQPGYAEAQAEQDRLMGIYQASSDVSKTAWAAYDNFAKKYDGRTFDLRFEKSEYERVTKRGEELYKAYEEAENKSYDDMVAMLDASNKRSDIWTKTQNKIDDSFDILNGAKEKRNEYWDNYEQELKSKMEVIESKINGDYDYYADMEPLNAQLDEILDRANKQFLQLYNNLDAYTSEPPDDVPPGFPDPKTDPDAYYDPFANEVKPDLGAQDGDELASSLSGGSYGNSYDVGGGDFRGIDQIIRMYNDPKGNQKYGDKMMKNINQIMLDLDLVKKTDSGLGSVASVGGVDATAAATAAAASAEKKKKKKNSMMVAHFVPRGDKLPEEMFRKKSKLKKPNQFFNQDDIKPEFPENPPPKLDPNTGKHPEYGKKASRYKKLDPISANSMPPTGDPEIDAVVNKQKTINKIKKMARKNLKESDFTNITKGNKVGQTFQHTSGATITIDATMGDTSMKPSQVTLDLGFGEKITVDAPGENEFGFTGVTKPLDMQVKRLRRRQSEDEINDRLDASKKASGAETAKVTTDLSLEEKKVEVQKYKNAMEEYDKKSVERSKEINSRIQSNIKSVKSYVSKFGESLASSYLVGSADIRIAQGGKTLLVISHSGFNYDDSKKFNVRVYEAEPGKTISKKTGNFGKISGGSNKLGNKYNSGSQSGQATIMYVNLGGLKESRSFEIKDLPEIPQPEPPEFMKKNMNKGWQPSIISNFDQEFINKMKIFTGKNFVSSLGGSNFAAQLAVQLAQGDLSPITKSPGPAITNIIKSNIEFVMGTGKTKDLPDFDSKGNKLDPALKKNHSFFNPITGNGAVRYNAYGNYGVGSAPVSASLGQYSIERTDKGIRISDKFDISSGFTSPGGAAYFNPLTKLVGGKDVQSTGETLTAIAARRAAELGYDMVDADTGETLQPVYSGEEEFNSRNFPNSGAPTIATPKGFNIKIDFTIPWSSFSPQTANLLKIGGKQIINPLPNIKTPLSDVFDRDDVSFKKKKKEKVNESNTFSKLKKIRNK